MLDMSVKFMDNLVVPPKTIEDFIDLKINHGRFSKKITMERLQHVY